MSRLRPFDRWVRWATLLALALATLAPGVAHALRHLRGDTMPWSQLCSATGSKRVVFGWEAGDDESTPRAHAFEQCMSCALHHDAGAPPAAADAVVLRAELAHAVPLLFLHAPRPQHAWRSAQPRAPPAQA
ncbi:MAG TPA: DUF2946 domain-containing protein [Burkholderiaceae bacterium]|nr:DUF2946 domain-containing protein [Burkholderiaceae bacterium]